MIFLTLQTKYSYHCVTVILEELASASVCIIFLSFPAGNSMLSERSFYAC